MEGCGGGHGSPVSEDVLAEPAERLGKDAVEARDDDGMTAFLVSHLLLTRTLCLSSQLRGASSQLRGLIFTHCLQVPCACVYACTRV